MQEAAVQKLKLASELSEQGKLDQALKACEEGIRVEPDSGLLFRFLGSLQLKNNNYDSAEEALRQASQLDPNDVDTLHLLAITQSENQLPLRAHQTYSELLAQQRGALSLWNDYALNLCRLGHFNEAVEIYQKVLEAAPQGNVKTQYNLGTLQLFLGNFAQGWNGYALRNEKDRKEKPRIAVSWKGQAIENNQRVLIYREQGIGDEILMASCYQDFINRYPNSEITILCNPRLEALFKRNFPDTNVMPVDAIDDQYILHNPFQWQVSAADLPFYFRQNKDSFNHAPLTVDASKQEQLLNQLSAKAKHSVRIGLSWLGGKSIGKKINYRSIPLEEFYPLFRIPNITWVNLQHGDIEQDIQKAIAETGADIISVEEASPYGDFDDYGALISALNHVVSVDNAVANLAGALGQSCSLLAPTYPFWWWTHGVDQNPWFPSVDVLFREPEAQSWSALVEQVQQSLQRLVPAST